MACNNETAREMTAALVAQATPFYVVTGLALTALALVAHDMYRGRIVAPAVTRAVVAFTLVGLLGFGLWQFAYDRARIAALSELACRAPTSDR